LYGSRAPQVWDIKFIREIIFGVVSSLFDFLTFAALVFHSDQRGRKQYQIRADLRDIAAAPILFPRFVRVIW